MANRLQICHRGEQSDRQEVLDRGADRRLHVVCSMALALPGDGKIGQVSVSPFREMRDTMNRLTELEVVATRQYDRPEHFLVYPGRAWAIQ